jgi:hypothetical protein
MSEIIPNLYLGNYSDAERNEWTTIISICPISFHCKTCKNHHILDIEDDLFTNILQYFDFITHLINTHLKNGDKVLVHCVVGMSRSASMIIAYLMKYHKMNLISAFRYTKFKRPIINPNPSFMKQLKQYELLLSGKPINIEKAAKFGDISLNDYMQYAAGSLFQSVKKYNK